MRTAVAYPLLAALVWLAVVSGKPAIERGFGRVAAAARHEDARAANPLLPGLREAARRYGIRLPPIEAPERLRSISLHDAALFMSRPRSYDVIVFGDSSLVWSFSPQIVEQVSGRRVAFFGCESALPTRGFMELAAQIAHTYLREGGSTLFLFADWVWASDPAASQPVPEMDQMIALSKEWRAPVERSIDAVLRLPRLDLYEDLVEPLVAPARHRERHLGAQGRGCSFFSWGRHENALFLYCSRHDGEPDAKDAHASAMKNVLVDECPAAAADAHVAANLRALAETKIPGKHLVLPLIDHPATALTCEARKIPSLPVVDLPRLAVERGDIPPLEFESVTHVANTSSVPASVLLGHAIERLR